MATFGKTSNGASNSTSSVDKIFVSSATPTSSGTVTGGSARVWLSSAGSTSSKFLIYADSSGSPGALLATSDQVTVSNTSEAQVDYTFSGGQQISITRNTTYWIGIVWQDPGTPSVTVSRDGTANMRKEQTLTYPTMPDPFGTPSATNTGPIDAFVTYTENKIATVSDNFDDNSLNTSIWSEWTAGDLSETSQTLRMTSTTSASYKGGDVLGAYDLSGSSVHVEVVNALSSSLTDAGTYLQIVLDGSNYLTMYKFGNNLIANKDVAGTITSVATTTYNSSTHRWWRIRESSGTIYYDYSSDGSSWSNLGTTTVSWTYTGGVYPSLFIGTDSANGSTETAIFDNFNVTPSGTTVSTSDSISFTDQLGPIYSDQITVRDRSDTLLTSNINVNDSVTISESIGRLLTSFINVSDSITVSENVNVSIGASSNLSVNVFDSITISESIGRRLDCNVSKSENITISENVQVNKYSTVFTWKGISWTRRDYGGGPQYNNNWEAGNVIGPDSNDYMTLRISNPTGTSPIAAEFDSNVSFGYGYYMMVLGSRVDNLPYSAVWGGMFTYDSGVPIYFNEIDVNETSSWGEPNPPVTSHNYYYNNGGVAAEHDDPYTTTSDAVTTHTLKWTPGRLEFNSYVGTGTGGTLLKNTVATANIPTPASEVLIFNAWVFDGGSDDETVTPQTDIVIRDFSFASVVEKSDNITVSENVKVVLESNVNKSDSITVSESIGRELNSFVNKSDSITVSESIGRLLESYVNKSDSVTTSENTQVLLESNINKSDSITITESVQHFVTPLFVNVNDSITVTDSPTVSLPTPGAYSVVIAENIAVSESVGMALTPLYVNVNDNVAITESLSELMTSFVNKSDSITITESIGRLTESYVNKSDNITITESIGRREDSYISTSDSITVTENVNIVKTTLALSVSDSISVIDSPSVYVQQLTTATPHEITAYLSTKTLTAKLSVANPTVHLAQNIITVKLTNPEA